MSTPFGYVHEPTPTAAQVTIVQSYADVLTEIIHEDIPQAVNPDEDQSS